MVGVFVGVVNDKFKVAEWRLECDQFALEHVDGTDTLKSIFEGLNFRESRHVLFDVANDLSIIDSFGLEPRLEEEEFRPTALGRVVEHWSGRVQEST